MGPHIVDRLNHLQLLLERKCTTGKRCGQTCIAKEKECRLGADYESPGFKRRALRLRRAVDAMTRGADLVLKDDGTDTYRLPLTLDEVRDNPDYDDILNAATLWSNGNVNSVRDPEKNFDPSIAGEPVEGVFLADGRYEVGSPTLEDYQRARDTIEMLSLAPAKPLKSDVTRGVALSPEAVDKLEPGAEFDMGIANSFTGFFQVSEDFAYAASDEDPTKEAVIFELGSGGALRGTDITMLSAWAGEDEFLTGGRTRVASREYNEFEEVWTITLEQV